MQHGETIDRTTTAQVSWHTRSVEDAVRAFAVDPTVGLTAVEVSRRREQSGTNALAAAKGRSVLTILVAQFRSLITAAAAGIEAGASVEELKAAVLKARPPKLPPQQTTSLERYRAEIVALGTKTVVSGTLSTLMTAAVVGLLTAG